MSQSQDSVSSNQQEAHSTSLAGRIGLFLGPLFMLAVLVLPAPISLCRMMKNTTTRKPPIALLWLRSTLYILYFIF